MYLCQFDQNLKAGSEERARTRFFHSYMILVTLKIRSRSPNLITPKVHSMMYVCQFGVNLAIGSEDSADKAFSIT